MYVKVKGKVASVGELATISTKNCDEELRMLCMMIELELVGLLFHYFSMIHFSYR